MKKPSSDICIEIRDLSFRYPLSEKLVLNHINLEFQRGEYVVITGPTGCGKTTLGLCLNGIIPNLIEGEQSGDVIVEGHNTNQHPVHVFTPLIGLVFQNPEDQLFSLKVSDEIAFGVENMGYSHAEIVERVEAAIEKVGLTDRRDYSIFNLSGGQKQKVAIASNLALAPDILVLDAPTADLDPVSSTEVIHTLFDLRQQDPNRTFIVIDSDISRVVSLATRLIVMKDGHIWLDGSPQELLMHHFDDLVNLGIRVPDHLKVMHWLMRNDPNVRTFDMNAPHVAGIIRERVASLNAAAPHPTTAPTWVLPEDAANRPEQIVGLQEVSFRFEKGPVILDHSDLSITAGEFVAVIGENGTGKSTLLKLLSGLLKPQAGSIQTVGIDTRTSHLEEIYQHVGYLFQNPDHQLFMSTVEAEIGFGPQRQGQSPEEVAQRVEQALHLMGLEPYRRQHPFTLSRGQRQRLAVATVLAARPKLLLLDEPTTGQDQVALDHLMQLIQNLISEEHTTVVMVTHDMDLVARYASRVIVLDHGQVLIDAAPAFVFTQAQDVLQQVKLKPPEIVNLAAAFDTLGEGVITLEQLLGRLQLYQPVPFDRS